MHRHSEAITPRSAVCCCLSADIALEQLRSTQHIGNVAPANTHGPHDRSVLLPSPKCFRVERGALLGTVRFYGDATFTDNYYLAIRNDGGSVR